MVEVEYVVAQVEVVWVYARRTADAEMLEGEMKQKIESAYDGRTVDASVVASNGQGRVGSPARNDLL